MSLSITKKNIVKFAPKGTPSFYDDVKAKVDEYFQTNNISEQANLTMYVKTVVMLALYFVPYVLIVTGVAGSVGAWLSYGMWALMGVGVAGIGASVMHDSNHGSYANNKFVNSMLGGVLNILGGYAANWRIQHNVLHHTYTNVHGLDEDIAPGPILRMSPHQPRFGIHRFQHIYAWFLYCLMNLFWVTVKDYRLLVRYHKSDLLRKEKLTLKRGIIELSILKVVYFGYALVLPILFSGLPWYHVVLGFVLMHVLGGLGLACIFQPAHVMETSEYPVAGPDRKMENSWAVHQVLNTTDFAPNNKFISWFIGGLNFQIEHHLFPQICHVHYPAIAKIVKSVAEEYGLPYQVQPTFTRALWEHGRMLKKLGEA